jgi:hypothetical protein
MRTTTLVRISLDSTTLAAAAYDACSETLELDFHDGTRYVYSGVASGLYHDLLHAASKGFFFNRHIRDHFPYVKLPAEN